MNLENVSLKNIWDYYGCLVDDLENTSRYVEPRGQETVYSFEFAKILILASTEAESVFKIICKHIKKGGCASEISEYKQIILEKYPKIVESVTHVSRLDRDIKPFENWGDSKLSWWNAYQSVKHNRKDSFSQANYINAVTALCALYILICYYSMITKGKIEMISNYITSDYVPKLFAGAAPKKLPDFEL